MFLIFVVVTRLCSFRDNLSSYTLDMHTFLHGFNTSVEAENKPAFRGSPPSHTRSSPTLVCPPL